MSVVSVIIVNWNGKHLLVDCLDTLRNQTFRVDEILVVDNGSTDGSQDVIQERYPEVTLIELDRNAGFSIANNIGIQRAKGDYIALLNNDVLLDREWMAHMVVALEADGRLGSCACKMVLYQQPTVIDSAGINMRSSGAARNRGLHEQDAEKFQQPAKVFGACAGAALYRASMFQDIGGFDEDFYIYFEDVDLSFRAQLAGYDCLYVPRATAYHHHSASGSRFGKKYFYVARNSVFVIVKNMPAELIWRNLLHVAAVPLSYAVYSGMAGHMKEYAHVSLSTLRLLPHMLRKRRAIQETARRSAQEIQSLFT